MFKKICLSILAVLMCLSVTGNRLFADDGPIEAQYFEMNSSYEELKIGESIKLNPVVYPENATGYSLEFGVEYGGVVSVDSDGTITGVAEGDENVIITLKNSAGETVYSSTVSVSVISNVKHYLIEYYVSSNGELNKCGVSWKQPVGAVINFREPWATKATKITVNGVEVSGTSYTITGNEDGDKITIVHYVPYLGNAYSVTGKDTYILGVDGNYDFFTENSDFMSVQLDGDMVDYSSETQVSDWYLPDYVMKGLALGNHTVKVKYYDGYGEKVFTVISPESMKWNDPEYVWKDDNSSVTATIVCATDSSIVITETVNTIKTVLTPSTCAVAGSARYTANFGNSLFTSQIKEEKLPLAEHTYAFGGWNWVDGDPVTATGRFECSVCSDKQVVDAVVTIESDTSSCNDAGVIRYKGDVHFGELAEIGYHDVSTEPLGHSWNISWEWSNDYSNATLIFNCKRCDEKKSYSTETRSTTIEPTCEAAGSITYLAYIEIGDEAYDDTRTVELPQLEHVYSYKGIEWDGWEAKAHYTCNNCHGDFYVKCEVLTTVDNPASCTEPGEKTAVATVEEADSLDGAKHQDTKHEDYKALGHKYGDWKYDGEEVKTHTHVCANDPSHTETQPCEFDEGVTEGDITTYSCKICGGTYSVKEGITINDVIRIAGANRFGTSQDIALMFKQNNNVDKLDAVILANGDNFADALAGSYLAAVKNAPIIITRAGKEAEINKYIRSIIKSDGTIYVLGGTAAVPESCLNSLTGEGYKIERIAGNNRYLTNLAILDKAGVSGDTLLIATGTNYADSLSASATGLPMLLVKDLLTEEQKNFLNTHRGMKLIILGGQNAVNTTIETHLRVYGEIKRISGANRAGTSLEIAKKFFPEATTAVIAYSHNFPDGLCGGPLANQIKSPLILTRDNDADATASYMKSKGIKAGYVLGGTSVLTDSLVRKLYGMRSSEKIIEFNK